MDGHDVAAKVGSAQLIVAMVGNVNVRICGNVVNAVVRASCGDRHGFLVRGVLAQLFKVSCQGKVLRLHVSGVGYAYVAEDVTLYVDEAVLVGMVEDPGVIGILLDGGLVGGLYRPLVYAWKVDL